MKKLNVKEMKLIKSEYNTLVIGAAGSGKTTFLQRQYELNKENLTFGKGKSIVYDKNGEWCEKYYNPETDFILSANNERSIKLDLFDYLRNQNSISNRVDILIPFEKDFTDSVWTFSAREILHAVYLTCFAFDSLSNSYLVSLINLSKEELIEKFEAAIKIATERENAETVKIIKEGLDHINSNNQNSEAFFENFKKRTKSLNNFNNSNDEGFKFNGEWCNHKSTLFLVNNLKNKEDNEILFRLFLNYTEVGELMSDIVFYIDDFQEFCKDIKILGKILSFGRSFDSKIFLSIQNVDQLKSIYNENEINAIITLCFNFVVLRSVNKKDTIFDFSLFVLEFKNTEYLKTFECYTRIVN